MNPLIPQLRQRANDFNEGREFFLAAIAEIERLEVLRDELAKLLATHNEHELTPHPECECPVCSVHGKWKYESNHLRTTLNEIAEKGGSFARIPSANGKFIAGHFDGHWCAERAREAIKEGV